MYSHTTPRLSPSFVPISNSPSPRNAVQHLLRILCASAPTQRTNPPSFQLTLNPPARNPIIDLHPSPLRPKPPLPPEVEKIITLETMGFNTTRILSKNPDFCSASLESILRTVFYIQSKGIRLKDLLRIVYICPDVITRDIQKDLEPVFDFLSKDLKVDQENFQRVISRCPRILATSVRNQLKPTLEFLRKIGINDDAVLSYKFPHLLVLSLKDTIIPKMHYLVSLGFERRDVEIMIARSPNLLTSSIDESIKPKADYFFTNIKGTLEELKSFPHYFSYCLERRIKPRHNELIAKGIEMPLGVMLKSMDEEFSNLVAQLEKEHPTSLFSFILK